MKNLFNNLKNKVYVALMSVYMTIMCTYPAFADVESTVKSMVETGVNVVFNLLGGGIAITGIIMLFNAGMGFFKGMQARDGEQQRDAGNNIGVALLIIVLAAVVFIAKTPVLNLLAEMYTV